MHHEIQHPTGWGWDFLAKKTLPILDGEGPRMLTETLRPPKLRWSLVDVSPNFGFRGLLFHLLINGVYWGYDTLILTFGPNFQQDIQVRASGV